MEPENPTIRDAEEAILVEIYRNADPRKRDLILRFAEKLTDYKGGNEHD